MRESKLSDQPLLDGWHWVASSKTAHVAFNPEAGVYFKQFLPRGPGERVKALLRGSRAQRDRRNALALQKWGFTAPKPLAHGKLKGGSEFLFSSAVAGTGVSDWLLHRLRGSEHRQQRWQLLTALGTQIGRLHRAGFTHGDLRSSNVLAELGPQGFRFGFIDNERSQFTQPPVGKHVLRNIMQLNMHTPSLLSRSDRWRFMLAYGEQRPELSHTELRILASEGFLWAMRRLRKKGEVA